ncbi:inner centromere protein, ARK binding region [Ancylostoma caninum]|uniref:Inner centromere protein, ARK binding region n=1 Tax=Ancylostoma caninum TaxID=29170 RepID=A0A368G568_ANCCA|nr:inner centromere protein, ARK binding region [Ancylostoma caninum]
MFNFSRNFVAAVSDICTLCRCVACGISETSSRETTIFLSYLHSSLGQLYTFLVEKNIVHFALQNNIVKQEVLSSKQEHAISRVTKASAETPPRRVLRSTSRTKATATVSTVTRPHVGHDEAISPLKTRQKTTATTTRKEKEVRAVAGASHTRLQRVVHQHVVTTPCKPQFKSAVIRAVQHQEFARDASPKRPTGATPSNAKASRTPRATRTGSTAKHKIEEQMAKEKIEQNLENAARTREEQCRERAERIRKEREEKALKARQVRKQLETAEKLKAEALKRKEERDERRLEEIRLKSPARSKASSRVVSPARVPKMVANHHPRSPTKVLFPSTPGRVPSKIARVVGASGETSREPTMNTPSRQSRRKPFPCRMARLDSDGSTSDSPSEKRAIHLHTDCEERALLQNKEEGVEERLNEKGEGPRMKLNDQEHLSMENLKMEIDVIVSSEEDLRSNPRYEEQGDCMMEFEDQRKMFEDEEEREREGAFIQEQLRRERLEAEHRKEEEMRLERERKEEERRLEEEQKRMLMEEQKRLMEEQQRRLMEEQQRRLMEEQKRRLQEEQKLREEAEAKNRERQLAEEEEEAKRRLNVSSCAELHNRHFDNVSFDVSSAYDKSSSRHSSYEMTPDKKHAPATENDYNIEDLSSGDETDQEDAPRKKVPSWAEGLQFRRTIERQNRKIRSGEFDPDAYFGEIMAPDLGLIFGSTKVYPRRGSSGIWESPIGKPRPGVGAFQLRLNNKY